MNEKNELGAVELLVLGALVLEWAVATIVRLLLVPAVALVLVVLTPRRHAPKPAAVEPEPVLAAPIAPEPEAAAPVVPGSALHPLADLAEALEALPQRRLMELAGTRRRLPKRQLAALLLAMPL